MSPISHAWQCPQRYATYAQDVLQRASSGRGEPTSKSRQQRSSAWRLTLVAGITFAGLGAGLIAATATTSEGWLRAVWGVVGGVAGLVGATVTDRSLERKAEHAAAVKRRGDMLSSVITTPNTDGSYFNVLLPTSQVAPFHSRRRELERLANWRDDLASSPVILVTGPAGTGKTRLITQFAATAPATWFAGWLNPGCGSDAVQAAKACGDAALILVDDADSRTDVGPVLEELVQRRGGPTVKVVLIARAGDLLPNLLPALTDRNRGVVASAAHMLIAGLGDADDWTRWYGQAVRAYAGALRTPPPDLPAALSGQAWDANEPILTLHARALLAVLESLQARPTTPVGFRQPFSQVAELLFQHEQHRWNQTAGATAGLTPARQNHAMAAFLVARPASQAEAASVLRDIPDWTDATAERLADIVQWTQRVYPADPQWPLQVKPDMLAEWFVADQLTCNPDLVALMLGLTPGGAQAALRILAHASDHQPQAVHLFAELVASDPEHLAGAGAVAAATASVARGKLDRELAVVILQASWADDALGRTEAMLPAALPRTLAAAGEVRVNLAREGSNAAALATALSNLGGRLHELGRYQEALDRTQEAVTLSRELVRDNPSRHNADLATALNNHGLCLRDAGCYQEALDRTREALTLRRELVRDNPSRYNAELATALNNLGVELAQLARYQEASDRTQEAVELRRRLARGSPARYNADLATALGNLGNRLAELGQYEKALPPAEEAVTLLRKLARANPARHNADLAAALNNLGVGLAQLARCQEALDPFEAAVRLRRELARDDPAGHNADLASALKNLANCKIALGGYQEALERRKEAVDLWRWLTETDPATYEVTYKRELAGLQRDMDLYRDASGQK
jgi:tetratricopeptide (TPR) repeat protein